jgi:hypothetical protein
MTTSRAAWEVWEVRRRTPPASRSAARRSVRAKPGGAQMNTRTIAIIALIIAVIVLIVLLT